METAQHIIPNASPIAGAGFNSRLFGLTFEETVGYHTHPTSIGSLSAGWNKADKLIKEGKIYYRHIFPHGNCNSLSFAYGGSQVCNDCGRKDIDKPWWIVKCYPDGNTWCCVGEGFEDLQASENYAFGDTREDALHNYALKYQESR